MAALGKAGFQPLRQLRRVERGLGHILDRHLAVGAGDREISVLETDIGLGRFEQMRGDLLALGDQLVAGFGDRGAADRQRARAAGAAAETDRRGVALHHPDLVEWQAEPFGGELCISRLVPLARGLRPHQHRQGAGLVEAQFGEFVRREA